MMVPPVSQSHSFENEASFQVSEGCFLGRCVRWLYQTILSCVKKILCCFTFSTEQKDISLSPHSVPSNKILDEILDFLDRVISNYSGAKGEIPEHQLKELNGVFGLYFGRLSPELRDRVARVRRSPKVEAMPFVDRLKAMRDEFRAIKRDYPKIPPLETGLKTLKKRPRR